MREDADYIIALQRRLAAHRRTLDFLEIQRAQFGAFTPTYIWHQFDEARGEIVRLKGELRGLGVSIDDRPGDQEVPEGAGGEGVAEAPARSGRAAALLLAYQRMLLDQTRYLPLAGMSRWGDLSVQLSDIYVERALTPAATPPAAGAGADPAQKEKGAPLADLVREPGARILLDGDVGSGKTTCLHTLALACATRAIGEQPGAGLVAAWPDPLPIPLLLSANEIALALARGEAALDEQRLPTLSAFWGAIEEWLRYSDLAALVPTFQRLLERGACLVMIDGLDDLPPAASRHAFAAALGRFVARYPDNRYVVTCRYHDPGLLAPLASFARHSLPPLDRSQIDDLAERWYAAVAGRVGVLLPEDVSARVAAVRGALRGDARLSDLARAPLAAALCVLAHAEGHALPQDRSVVLRRLADLLAVGWGQGRLGGDTSMAGALDAGVLGLPERRLALLAPIALAFQSRSSSSERPATLSRAEVEAAMAEGLAEAGVAHDTLIPGLLASCCRHGLLARAGYDAYTMPRAHVREFLAALALAAQPDFPTRAHALRREPRWHEALFLAVYELRRRSTPHVARLLARLLLHPPAGAAGCDAGDLLLAAGCLAEMDDRSRPNSALRAEVHERLIDLMGARERTTAERVRAGLLLGSLGDPRFSGPLPPLAHVAGGPCTFGAHDGYDDEGPAQRVDLPAFAIGIYPVTNQEYAAFLSERWDHPRPRYWHDPRFNNPACPVVGVTRHDAAAYCAWLTARLWREGLLAPGAVVRLPTEIEWEKAASWDPERQAARRYPWGDEWEGERANTAERRSPDPSTGSGGAAGSGAWFTTPVGCYGDGVSPYGLHDCIGNVWEWTASVYASYPGAAAPFYEAGSYALRGSSCASNHTHARCTYRSRLPASYWRYHLGFRIAIGEPL